MPEFDSVGENKDELFSDLFKKEDDNAVENNLQSNSQSTNNSQSVCVICTTSADLTILFIFCKHLCMCTECYGTYLASQINDHDGDDIIECPMCRAIHKQAEIIQIFKP